jgi:hypothetical protein
MLSLYTRNQPNKQPIYTFQECLSGCLAKTLCGKTSGPLKEGEPATKKDFAAEYPEDTTFAKKLFKRFEQYLRTPTW